MNLSYWEIKSWFSNVDFAIIGSGIVGLNCALNLRKKNPTAKIVVLEKGMLPQGASTKNAGFACFGSVSEIIEDLKNHSEAEVLSLIKKRINGLSQLRELLGDKGIGYHQNGGYEIFPKKDLNVFEKCKSQLHYINEILFPLFESNIFKIQKNHFNFKNITRDYIFNPFEGQIDTGVMMQSLLKKAHNNEIKILNNADVISFTDMNNCVEINTIEFDFKCSKLFIATNGFSNKLLKKDIRPARAQVLITKPINNLKIKGTFHLDKGYYYFRNIDDRILLGGGRNLDFKTEETDRFGLNTKIQNELENILKTIVLAENPFEIDHRWSGIMGIGNKKNPIIETISNNVYCGIRLGGMGIAIGSTIGTELANKI